MTNSKITEQNWKEEFIESYFKEVPYEDQEVRYNNKGYKLTLHGTFIQSQIIFIQSLITSIKQEERERILKEDGTDINKLSAFISDLNTKGLSAENVIGLIEFQLERMYRSKTGHMPKSLTEEDGKDQ